MNFLRFNRFRPQLNSDECDSVHDLSQSTQGLFTKHSSTDRMLIPIPHFHHLWKLWIASQIPTKAQLLTIEITSIWLPILFANSIKLQLGFLFPSRTQHQNSGSTHLARSSKSDGCSPPLSLSVSSDSLDSLDDFVLRFFFFLLFFCFFSFLYFDCRRDDTVFLAKQN